MNLDIALMHQACIIYRPTLEIFSACQIQTIRHSLRPTKHPESIQVSMIGYKGNSPINFLTRTKPTPNTTNKTQGQKSLRNSHTSCKYEVRDSRVKCNAKQTESYVGNNITCWCEPCPKPTLILVWLVMQEFRILVSASLIQDYEAAKRWARAREFSESLRQANQFWGIKVWTFELIFLQLSSNPIIIHSTLKKFLG